MKNRLAFTLIELLIVVAIIAILAAIAAPNFLEAQVRSKIARVKSDMRSLATALESYITDYNAYPQAEINGTLKYLFQLTTPVAYIADKNLKDPFTPEEWVDITQIPTLRYYGFNENGVINAYAATGLIYRDDSPEPRIHWYMLFSHGPDRVRNNLDAGSVSGTFIKEDVITDLDKFVHYVYDGTNGTKSAGEILRAGGSPTGATAAVARFVMSAQ